MSYVEDAATCFQGGFNCAQAVLSAFAVELGLERELALRVAGGFGGGMGRLGEVCGAVTGAIMVLGLKYGKVRTEDDAAREEAYQRVQEFAQQFRARHGALRCRDLLGCDLSTPEGRREAHDRGITATLCPQLVRDAAEIAEGLLSVR
jgi:C_GCAxxG_C_C family probable redox protein